MATLNESVKAMANLNLWLKLQSGDSLMLSDITSILPLRWTYFRDNWEFIKQNLVDIVPDYSDPDFLNQQINDFSKFIESQRNSKANINPFSDTVLINRFIAIFDNISIDSIPLSNEENKIIAQTKTTINNYSKNDFLSIRNALRDYRDRYADTVSLSDADYNKAFNKSSIPPQINATITDMNFMATLQDSVNTADFVLANFFANDSVIDPFALARANANNPEINIGQYSSGRLVKLEYGQDLQSLATKYLGDPNKWLDIAIANGLKPPYIDEIGQKIPLISNGNGNQVNIAGVDINGNSNIDKLYINQIIFIKSNVQVAPDQRTIINIRQIPVSDEIIIELDGDPNLNLYSLADGAYVRVFKPNTVNSGFYVLIPSTKPLQNTRQDEVPWFLAKAADDEKQTKIDIAVDDKGDLNFTTNGDLKLSYGLDNAVQAIKFKLSTELGFLRYHPEYGLVNIMGSKNNNITHIKNLVTESITSQIQADARYERVEHIAVDYHNTGGSGASYIEISLSVRLAGGGNKILPITFTVAV